MSFSTAGFGLQLQLPAPAVRALFGTQCYSGAAQPLSFVIIVIIHYALGLLPDLVFNCQSSSATAISFSVAASSACGRSAICGYIEVAPAPLASLSAPCVLSDTRELCGAPQWLLDAHLCVFGALLGAEHCAMVTAGDLGFEPASGGSVSLMLAQQLSAGSGMQQHAFVYSDGSRGSPCRGLLGGVRMRGRRRSLRLAGGGDDYPQWGVQYL